jgi:hypothetical protein
MLGVLIPSSMVGHSCGEEGEQSRSLIKLGGNNVEVNAWLGGVVQRISMM